MVNLSVKRDDGVMAQLTNLLPVDLRTLVCGYASYTVNEGFEAYMENNSSLLIAFDGGRFAVRLAPRTSMSEKLSGNVEIFDEVKPMWIAFIGKNDWDRYVKIESYPTQDSYFLSKLFNCIVETCTSNQH